jgi:hypothetical protein
MPAQKGNQILLGDKAEFDQRGPKLVSGNLLLLQSVFQLFVREQTFAHQQIPQPEAHISTSKTFLTIGIVK